MEKKKILFVTTRSPFSKIYSGDRKRSKIILEYLNKKNNLHVLYSDNLNERGKTVIKNSFFKRNFFDKIKGITTSLISLKPIQLGYFYSQDVNNFLKKNHNKYQTIIFHLIRSAQYLPKEYKGKKILEMTDLISKNYTQIIKSFSILNPLMYLYFLENLLLKSYEYFCFNKFDKIVLASRNDLKNTKIKINNKIIEIPNIVETNKRIYKFKSKNYKIIFVGNINYFPNKKAIHDFALNILPSLNKKFPEIQFHIVGEIKNKDKIYYNKIKNIYVHGPKKNLGPIIKNSICGICNVNIGTGTQMKMLTYMSYGLPCISSIVSFKNTSFNPNKEIIVFNNKNDLISKIIKLKKNKLFSNKISKLSYFAFKKKYEINKILSRYDKII